MARPDHFMYGVADLDAGVRDFESLTGVLPATGGSHPGRGTCNALASLGDNVYLEIIAPDPGQALENTFGVELAALETPGLITWCAAHADLTRAAADLRDIELEPAGPIAMSRNDPQAGPLAWELLFIGGHDLGLTVPFLIDWKGSPHPARSTPKGCTLKQFEIHTPETVALRGVLETLGLAVPVVSRERPALAVTLETPRAEVKLPMASPLPDRLF